MRLQGGFYPGPLPDLLTSAITRHSFEEVRILVEKFGHLATPEHLALARQEEARVSRTPIPHIGPKTEVQQITQYLYEKAVKVSSKL